MKLFTHLLFILVVVFGLIIPAPAGSQTPSGKEVVSPEAFVSYDPVARGKNLQVAVVMKIRPGFHVNAREVTADYLIPTDLRAEIPAGFKMGEITYPKGRLQNFTFSKDKKLNVYTNSVIIRVPLTVLATAPTGEQHLSLKLHYQACSDEICLPPTTLSLEASFRVTDNPGSARPAHAELFPK